MAEIGNLSFSVHLQDMTDADAEKIKRKLENLSVKLNIDGNNVNVSHTDLIKKQIEDAIKGVSIQSVNVDANALRTQIGNALNNATPQVHVALQKGTLANDLQAYLNNRTFSINVSVNRGSAVNAVTTAFANVSVPVSVSISSSAALQQLRQSLANQKIKVGIGAANVSDLIKDIETKIKGKKVKVGIEADPTTLLNSVKQSLQGHLIKASVSVSVDATAITRAVQSAINNANFTYSPNGRGANANSAAQSQRNLGNAYNYAAKGAYSSARASVQLGQSLRTNIRLAGELGTTIGNLASVFGLKDLLQNVIRIGGQLENQRIALGAILQDGGKATEMFSRIQSLAVKSPFGIMDLNQYAKQLSAYSVPFNELYDTMKRLADISAGVGVDMGRIILAFGQVKAAGFLKGTELRQFTEANIPMVDKLAERFTNLTGTIVDAGKVYDMISKKQVTFEDVKSVLWDLTDEGGMFNNMQEVLSESLASKWKNLADAVDVMFGKIADGSIGSGLKSMAEGLTELTKNWEYLIGLIASASTAFIIYKASVVLGSKQMADANKMYADALSYKKQEAYNLKIASSYRQLTNAEQQLMATTDKLTVADVKRLAGLKLLNKEEALRLIAIKKLDQATLAYLQRLYGIDAQMVMTARSSSRLTRAFYTLGNAFKGLWAAMKAMFLNPWTWVFAGITAIAEIFAYTKKKQEELDEMTKEVSESAKGSMETIGKELDKLKNIKLSELDDTAIKMQIKNLTTLIKNEAPYWQGILSEVFEQKADGTFVRTAREQLDLLIEKMKEVQDARQMLADNPEYFANAVDSTDGWLDESIMENFQDYEKAIKGNEKRLEGLTGHYERVKKAIDEAAGSNENFLKESAGKSIQQQVILLRKYTDEFEKFKKSLSETDKPAFNIVSDYLEGLTDIGGGAWDTFAGDINIFQQKVWEGLLSEGYTKEGMLDEQARQFVMYFGNKLIEKAQIQDPKVISHFWNEFLKNFGLNYEPDFVVNENDFTKTKPKYDASKDEVAKLWKKRAEEIDKAVAAYDKWKEIEGRDNARNRITGMDEFANLFNGEYGFALNLEDPTEAYRYIQSKLNKNLSAQNELIVQLGIKLSDAELKDAKDKLKAYLDETKKFIDKTTSQWDLYKQLFEATGNKTLSQEIAFEGQISFKDQLEQLRSEIEKQMNTLGVSISFEELIGRDKESLEQGGFASLANLIEAYNKENKKLKDESVKNFIDIIKSSKDFAQQIADIDRELQKYLSDLSANSNKMPKEELERRQAELVNRAEEEKTKVRFEEFKKSSDWVKVFDDLDRVSNDTLDMMIRKIEEFAKQAHLSEEVTKQLVDAMAKLRDESIERNPFKGLANSLKEYNRYLSMSGMVGEYDEHGKLITQRDVDDGLAAAQDDFIKSLKGVEDSFKDLQGVLDPIVNLLDSFGNGAEGLKDVVSLLSNALGSASNTASSFSNLMGLGIGKDQTLGSALGIKNAGLWGAAAGAGLSIISGLFAMHDKALQKEIEASERREEYIKNVSDNLEALFDRNLGGVYTMKIDPETKKLLQDSIIDYNTKSDSVYSSDTANTAKEALRENSYYDAQLASLKMQRDELEEQMRLEDEKKKTDKDKMADYQQQIAEMEMEISAFAETMANELYGIDFKGWANQLAESLVDAWASGEDAVQAYKDTVDDILKDVGVSIISQKIIEPLLNETMEDFLAQFEKDNGKLTDESMEILSGMYEGAEYAASATEAYLEGLKKLGIDVSETAEESSSGLSKGIQSVTEDTADLLGSYLNAIRQDVSVKRSLIEKLITEDIPNMSYLAEAQLQQLNMIQQNTKRNADVATEIRDLVNRVVDKGSNKLKV